MKAIPFVSESGRIRFSTKLFISCLILCTIPVLIIIHIFYYQAKSSIEEASNNFSALFATQLNNTINLYLTGIDNTSNALFTDYDIIYYLGQEDSFSTLDKINKNLQVNRMLTQYYTQMPYLQGITIIGSSGKVYSYGIPLDSMSVASLEQQQWYQNILASRGHLIITPAHSQTVSAHGTIRNIFSAGRLLTDPEGRKAGAILFHMSPNSLIYADDYISELSKQYNTRIIIKTLDGGFIFDSNQPHALAEHEVTSIPDENEYYINKSVAPSARIDLTIAVSKSVLYENIRTFRNMAIVITIITVFVIMVSSKLLSVQIMKPIKKLISNMKRVEDGYYHPIEETDTSMELHRLTSSYNLMIMKIKHLIEVVYLAKIKQDQTQFIALQNQINPHWLYNTLESIRMKAQLSGNSEVASMIKTLGRLFHMALSKKPTPNRIKDELDYVCAYLELQNIRYEGRFHLRVHIPEELLQTPIIKLVFQPIIENSIIHGFLDHSLSYEIEIDSRVENDQLHIVISDNGEGMDSPHLERVRTMLSVERQDQSYSSIGLLNIQERLKLNYGDDCGIRIDSIEKKGTQVTIMIPKAEVQDVQGSAG